MPRRALILAPEAPYPTHGGGALRTASLLHYLARRYDVDLIVFRQPGAPDPVRSFPAGIAREMHVIDLASHGRAPSREPRGMRDAWRAACRRWWIASRDSRSIGAFAHGASTIRRSSSTSGARPTGNNWRR